MTEFRTQGIVPGGDGAGKAPRAATNSVVQGRGARKTRRSAATARATSMAWMVSVTVGRCDPCSSVAPTGRITVCVSLRPTSTSDQFISPGASYGDDSSGEDVLLRHLQFVDFVTHRQLVGTHGLGIEIRAADNASFRGVRKH